MSRSFRFSAVIVLTALLSPTFAAEAQEVHPYHLGPQERLRVYVHEWPILTGEFAVSASGTLNLPMVGAILAKDRDTTQVAADISIRLQQAAKLASPPETMVDILQYRPFYILGGVERPGSYEYRPDMLVINAVALAGGVYRTGWAAERDVITARGQAQLGNEQLHLMRARELRLNAEANGAEALPAPQGDWSPEETVYLDQERNLFSSRLEQHRNQHDALSKSLVLLEGEIEALEGQAQAAKKQETSVKKELEETRGLVARSLAPAPRILPIERTLAQIEREQKEIVTAIMRARQQINHTTMQRDTLNDERRSAALTDLQTLQSRRHELNQQVSSASDVMRSTNSAEQPGASIEPVYTIVRKRKGVATEISASETTPLEPGDIVKVSQTDPRRQQRSEGSRTENPKEAAVQTR